MRNLRILPKKSKMPQLLLMPSKMVGLAFLKATATQITGRGLIQTTALINKFAYTDLNR